VEMEGFRGFQLGTEDGDEKFLATMMEIGHEINALLPLDELLDRIAHLARQLVDYQIISILLADEEQKLLTLRYSIGSPREIACRRIKFGEGLTGAAALLREAVRVADVTRDPRYIKVVEGVRSEMAIPLISRDRIVGVLDIQSQQQDYFRSEHQKPLMLIATQLAVAIDNSYLYENLKAKNEMMTTLHEVGQEIVSILDLDQLLKKVAENLHRVMEYDIFSIMLVDETEQILRNYLSVKFNRDAVEKSKIPLNKGLIGTAVARKRTLVINDVSQDSRYTAVVQETRSEMVVPLIYKEKVIGVFDLQSPHLNYFTALHEQSLDLLAGQVAIAIENARLYERVVAAEGRLDRELKIAREVQSSLIPDRFPELTGVQLSAAYRPARILGGDLYDFFQYEDQILALTIGDVAGKGAAAALYGALVSGILRTRAQRKHPPAEMLRLVNHSLRQRAIEGRFMTLCFATFDANTSTLRLSNSGAPPPLLCRNGTGEFLQVEGFPLGMFDKAEYREQEIILEPHDVVVFYTDGLLESRDLSGEEFGFERLKQVAASNCHLEAGKLTEKILTQIEKFTLGSGNPDDRTVLVLKNEGL
jgi:sigma-B regulation protein RsbU (phosphoserine phosphatase)